MQPTPSITIDLPWPPRALSPNARLHWAKVSSAKKKYRRQCGVLTRLANPGATGPQRIDYLFSPPLNRGYDRDNLLACMKAGIDGIADALGINDNQFHVGSVEIGPKAPPLGIVRVVITPIDGEQKR